VLAFVLNVLRIAALVAIGDARLPKRRHGGFHSQAGWIAFTPWPSSRRACETRLLDAP